MKPSVSSVPLLGHEDNRFDFLRLLAAWLVLFSHSYPLGGWPDREPLATTLGIDTFGGIGVAIFFVLSGYLVTISLERSPSRWVFLRRRAVRIYPALAVACLLCIFVLGLGTTNLPWLTYLRHGATWSYLNSATAWKIQYLLPGVFETTPVPHAVNGSLWSLPYELRCYLGLLLASVLPLGLRWKTLMALVFLVVVVLLRPGVPPALPGEPFWGMDYYQSKLGLLFAVGAVFASWRGVWRPNVWSGLLLIGAAFWLPHGGGQVLAFFGGLGVLVLWLALYAQWLPAIPRGMGDWSYGTYLYGFPVQQLLVFWSANALGLPVYLLVSTLLTLILAGLSWHWVEKPALRWK